MAGTLAREGRSLTSPDLVLPLLYGLTDSRGERALTPAEAARVLFEAGVRLVQVRDKDRSSRRRLEAARQCVSAAREIAARLVVNDRPDIALLSGADGVHVGEEDLPVWAARKILPPPRLVGVSTHSVSEAREAMADPGVSYVALGPVFATRSKESAHRPLGLDAVAEAARDMSKPLVAIGGIEPDSVGAVLAAGADTVAMIAGLLDGDARRNVELALESARRAGFEDRF